MHSAAAPYSLQRPVCVCDRVVRSHELQRALHPCRLFSRRVYEHSRTCRLFSRASMQTTLHLRTADAFTTELPVSATKNPMILLSGPTVCLDMLVLCIAYSCRLEPLKIGYTQGRMKAETQKCACLFQLLLCVASVALRLFFIQMARFYSSSCNTGVSRNTFCQTGVSRNAHVKSLFLFFLLYFCLFASPRIYFRCLCLAFGSNVIFLSFFPTIST